MCLFIGLIFMYVFDKHRVLKRVILVLYNIFIRDLSKDTPREICIFAPDVKLFFGSSDSPLVVRKIRKTSPNREKGEVGGGGFQLSSVANTGLGIKGAAV